MNAQWLCAALALAAVVAGVMAAGCGLEPKRFDKAGRDYSTLRDAPADEPKAVLVEVTAGGDAEREQIVDEVNGILAESGQFRPVTKAEDADLKIELDMTTGRGDRCEIKTQCTACNLSMRYLLPVHGEKYDCVATAAVTTPDGKPVAQHEARGRGKWAIWFWDTVPHTWFGVPAAKAKIRRKTLKALVVKICRPSAT